MRTVLTWNCASGGTDPSLRPGGFGRGALCHGELRQALRDQRAELLPRRLRTGSSASKDGENGGKSLEYLHISWEYHGNMMHGIWDFNGNMILSMDCFFC